jgi:hypothetical protein
MDPIFVVLTFVAVASGLAVFRVIAEQRDMSRLVRVARRRRPREGDIALQRLRATAEILRDLRR